MGLILDSSLFIARERGRSDGPEFYRMHGGEPHAIAAMTVAELYQGVLRADSPERRARRQQFVSEIAANYPVLPFGTEQALRYAEVYVELEKAGSMIGSHDLQIAAVALVAGYSVATLNPGEFQRVPGLTMVDLSKFRRERPRKTSSP